jgi:glycosyltransferase involved in cell wall biosynthesis
VSDLVSVIMPTYNSAAFMDVSVRSVLAQTYPHWELLIADDASSDDSHKKAQQYALEDSRIRALRLPVNGGAAEARNLAIREARGRYIAFLDSDDCWLPVKLEHQVAAMQANNWPFTYTSYTKVDESGRILGEVGVPSSVTYGELLKTCVIGCLTAMYDTRALGKVEMPLIRKRQDFGLWLRILKKTPRAYGLQEPLAIYKVRGDSISANKKSAASYTWKLYREVENLPLPYALWIFANYAVRGVLRTRMPSVARWLGVLQ